MMIELMKGRNEAVIRPNVVNDPKFNKKEIKGMMRMMLATKSAGPECFYGHATADEERSLNIILIKERNLRTGMTLKEKIMV